jgi:RNA polymerase sigma-70 factor (ECF subfamily)
VEQARRDPEAFGELYLRHVRSIYNYIFYRTGDPEEAEDLTSRVFLQALQHLPRFQERGLPFAAWLFRIAHNLVANWHRGPPPAPGGPALRERARAGPGSGGSPGGASGGTGAAASGPAAPAPGSPAAADPQFVEGLSNAEIARIMGRTEGAIRVLYHRTLEALRKELLREP